jgi:hypothetical protein
MEIAPERSRNNFNTIEELTSQATIPNIIDLDKEELTQVYENYSFERKPQPNLLINSYKEEVCIIRTTLKIPLVYKVMY